MLRLIPIALTAFFTYLYFTHSLYRHLSFNSHAFDLGIYTQISYLYAFGVNGFSTLKHMNLMADHFGPILMLLSPIYRIFPNSITLLFIQSLFVSLSCIPIYLIAYDKIKSHLFSITICLSYLTSAGLLSAISFDFHLTTISVLPLSMILFFWYFKRWKMYWAMLYISLLFKEDLPLFILGLGFFQLLRKQIKVGLFTIIFALISFFVIKFIIMPFMWAGANTKYIETSILPLTDPVSMIGLVILRPTIFIDILFNSTEKMSTITALYQPFAYLPLLSPLNWLTVIPYLFLRFSSNYIQMWTTDWHHNANLIPFLTVSTIFVVAKIKIISRKICLLLIMLALLGGLSPLGFLWHTSSLPFQNLSRFSYINNSIASIPKIASISAQSPLVPRLANREKIFLFPDIYDAEYIVLDSSLNSYPMNPAELKQKINDLEKSSHWKIFVKNKTLIIFQKIPI